MSVLKNKRTTSKAEFVTRAIEIYAETVGFLSRLSARYSRLVAQQTAELAGSVMDHAEMAQNIYPSDAMRAELRKRHLLEARAALMALDVRLGNCYNILRLNPEGAFVNSKGAKVPAGEATARLERMADSLGLKIDQENELIKGVLESDARRKKK